MQASGLNWLREDDAVIRDSLLKKTPLGSPCTNVLGFVQRKGWEREMHKERRLWLTVGARSVAVRLGHYWYHCRPGTKGITYRLDVFASWRFDQNDRLVDLTVQKEHTYPE